MRRRKEKMKKMNRRKKRRRRTNCWIRKNRTRKKEDNKVNPLKEKLKEPLIDNEEPENINEPELNSNFIFSPFEVDPVTTTKSKEPVDEYSFPELQSPQDAGWLPVTVPKRNTPSKKSTKSILSEPENDDLPSSQKRKDRDFESENHNIQPKPKRLRQTNLQDLFTRNSKNTPKKHEDIEHRKDDNEERYLSDDEKQLKKFESAFHSLLVPDSINDCDSINNSISTTDNKIVKNDIDNTPKGDAIKSQPFLVPRTQLQTPKKKSSLKIHSGNFLLPFENTTSQLSVPTKFSQNHSESETVSQILKEQLQPHFYQNETRDITKTPTSTTRPVILGSGLKKAMLEQVVVLTHKLGGTLLKEWSEEVTHLVVLTDDHNRTSRTLKFLMAVMKGLWIVSYNWIIDSLADHTWVKEEPYEATGDGIASNTPKKARLDLKKRNNNMFEGWSCNYWLRKERV